MRTLDPPLTIRGREPADRAFLEPLSREAFGEYSARGGVEALAIVERFPTLVACRGGIPVGFASLERIDRRTVALAAIAVSERERGTGIGRRLLRAAEGCARRWGARRLMLHTAEANLAAFELFHKNGFRVAERIPRFYRGVFNACLMVKRL